MTRIILVRHGETSWNNEGRFQGRLNVQLNKTGLEQAKALADYLKELKIEAVYASPLKRAKQTAEIISAHHRLEVILEDSFIEIDHGKWEGLSLEQVVREDNSLYKKWLDSPQDFSMPQGESLNQVKERVVPAFYRILTKHPEKTVLIVGHDAINKLLICKLLGVDNSHFWQIKQGNGGVTIFEYEQGQGRLVLLNDTCHLGGLIDTTSPGAL